MINALYILPLSVSWGWVRPTLVSVYGVFILIVIYLLIQDKREPAKSWAWLAAIVLIPIGGIALYMIFGRNHRKEKIYNRKEIADLQLQMESLSARQLYELNSPLFQYRQELKKYKEIITLLLNNNKSLLSARNRVKVLNNGAETFPAILEALRGAQSFIHIEYYIFEKDRIGREVASVLMEKARQGVEVRFIYDDVGSWGLSPKFLRRMKRAGVRVHCFQRVVFPWLTSKINYRNHRKIVVVDGEVGFTGGINIAKRYLTGTRLGIWRDTHLRIEGEAVAALNAVFAMDWLFVSGEKLLDREKYYPASGVDIETPIQIASSGPDSDWESIMQAFFAAMTKSVDHIYITTPYFLPNQAIMTAVEVAAMSGVDVRILLPERSDSRIAHWATQSYISELLEAKVKVYFYRKGFNHSKLIMIDSVFSSIGTANMDNRSFNVNFEVTAILYDEKVTRELEERFLEDLKDSEQVTASDWEARSRWDSFCEGLARLFSPLM
ncbi:MAG: cardiolipin synthase [Rikenellaceae bacterium]|nr:cardiolipin synthase [Rikenellaceae bacterium]